MTNIDRTTMIIAVVFAIFLWAYVHLAQATPEISRVIRDVPVQVVGKVPSGFSCALHDADQTIDIDIKGPPERVNNVLQKDVTARVDVTGIAVRANAVAKTTRKPQIFLPKGVKLARESVVTLLSYPLRQETYPVSVAFVTQPPPGTTVGAYQLVPPRVTLEGTRDALAQVKYVTVRVDPNQPVTEEWGSVPQPVDADGEQVGDVRVLTSTVQVRMATLTGQQPTRLVAVREPLLKNMPRGYLVRVAGSPRPAAVTLGGPGAALDYLQGFVETEVLDVHAIRKDTTVTVRLRVPDGLTVVEGTTVRVDLQVQPIQ
jgi:YbbR domain-containing protein